MRTIPRREKAAGFTLVEIMMSMVVLGFVLIAVAGIFLLFQQGSAQTSEYAEAQQNARIALDHITDHLRQAGSQVDYFRGQRPIVHAGPYQIALNADIDAGRTIDGQPPLRAINRNVSPNRVPVGGTPIYVPAADYQSDAETIVFTLDSSADGVITSADRGDDPEESGRNRNLFMLKRYVYGFNGFGANEVRESDIALVRGPNLSPTWNVPQPLFQYWYDHDENPATPDRLWGDTNNNGVLEPGEILALTEMPQDLLSQIRRVTVNVTSESGRYDKKHETNGGFLSVEMTSEVHVRNASVTGSQIRGMVFHDANGNGVWDTGESGIPGVEVRLAGQNRSVLTDNFGMYFFPLPAGTYSVQQIDKPGYTSTTPNLVSVTLASGEIRVVNFGDVAVDPTGVIKGTVYEDLDADGIRDADEPGIQNVLVSLDSGEQTYTNANGFYSFIVMVGNYIVVETVPTGFTATTPNAVNVTVAAQDDTLTVDFGNYAGEVYGTLEGHVFVDVNENGVRNTGEEGIPNVFISVSSGDTTRTNANGHYRFNLAPGVYSVTETLPAGYTATTVTSYVNIPITADTTIVRDFGNILDLRQDFVEIHISNTDRVLSVRTADLGEDDRRDTDIILGTALHTGFGNMLIFHNQWENWATPITELFNSDPTYRRDAGDNVSAIEISDFNSDGVADMLTGLEVSTRNNIQAWITRSGGLLGDTPDAATITSGTTEVLDVKLVDINKNGTRDLVVGLKNTIGTGGAVQTFSGTGGGHFSAWQYITHAGPASEYPLGEVWGVDTGDFDGDGDRDLVVGTRGSGYTGFIDIYLNSGNASGDFVWHARYQTQGGVNNVKVVDMMENDAGTPDILAAVSTGASTGRVLLWLNDGGVFGLPDTTGHDFGPHVTPRWPDDFVIAEGEPLCLAILNVNNDIYPDVAYGTRSSSLYTGDVYVLPSYGTLPVAGTKINNTSSGEIVAIDVADFNKNGRPDIVVGTRSSSTQGKLVAYFGRQL